MQEEPRITDHEPVIAAAREDAGREGARMVQMTINELWRLIHRAPSRAADERRAIATGLQPR